MEAFAESIGVNRFMLCRLIELRRHRDAVQHEILARC